MSLLSIPYPAFTPGETASSSQVNANFAAVETAVNNIDNTNIGAAGLYASQLIPLTTGEATFGGSESYTFANTILATDLGVSVAASGQITAVGAVSSQSGVLGEDVGSKGGGTGSYGTCPPVFLINGATTANTEHIVRGTASTNGSGNYTVVLSGSAVFSSTSSYNVFIGIIGTLTASLTADTVIASGSEFNVYIANSAGVGVGGVTFAFLAIGY